MNRYHYFFKYIAINQDLFTLIRKVIMHLWLRLDYLSPIKIFDRVKLKKERIRVEEKLFHLCKVENKLFTGKVLVDGMFDNPNQWLRLTLFRAALGLFNSEEIGLLGPFNRNKAKRTFYNLGIKNIVDMYKMEVKSLPCTNEAKKLISKTSCPEDILNWKLPYGVPAHYIYDGLLRRQKSAVVDINNYKIIKYVAEALQCIKVAKNILDDGDYQLLVLSNHIDFRFSSLCWIALQMKIPVICLYGVVGQLKYVRYNTGDDLFSFMDGPSLVDIDSVSNNKAEKLRELGEKYLLEHRLVGNTQDIGAVYAYQRHKKDAVNKSFITEYFGWNANNPVIAVFTHNWFDNPHGFGLKNFRDFKEWLNITIEEAEKITNVNWLIRGHPIDQWYGGQKLEDVMPRYTGEHIRICNKTWNTADIIKSTDAVVTIHGTAGIEFAALGKPVLLGDRGWYHECGIGLWSKSKEEYISNLHKKWWLDLDLQLAKNRALLFSGLFYCSPDWQKKFILGCDSRKQELYTDMNNFIDVYKNEIKNEIEHIKKWYLSDHRKYHTWKMLQADEFLLSNIKK